MKSFVDICRMTQHELKKYLPRFLRGKGYTVVVDDGFIYAKGNNVPVMLTAHMDTVHKEPPSIILRQQSGNKISSPQGIGGDDRCGIYMIMKILKDTDLRPTILFCEDEEIGGIGSSKFCRTELIKEVNTLKFLIELDRTGKDDAVFYDCDNPDFTDFILDQTGYKESYGSFSDISVLSPASGIASVNLSCGYYNAHTKDEYVLLNEMYHTIEVTEKLLIAAQKEDIAQYEYYETKRYGLAGSGLFSKYYYDRVYGLFVSWSDENFEEYSDYVECTSQDEGFGVFFRTHPNVCWYDILDYEVV